MSRHFDPLFSSLVLHGLKKKRIYIKKWKRKHIKPNVGIEGLYVVPSPVVVSGS